MGGVAASVIKRADFIPIEGVDGAVCSDKVLLAATVSPTAQRALNHLPFMRYGHPTQFIQSFHLILINLELLETIKAYLATKVVHSEIVREVALIAITRR